MFCNSFVRGKLGNGLKSVFLRQQELYWTLSSCFIGWLVGFAPVFCLWLRNEIKLIIRKVFLSSQLNKKKNENPISSDIR